jgi:RNA polymerase sigma-70 factor (ECF subfamily)
MAESSESRINALVSRIRQPCEASTPAMIREEVFAIAFERMHSLAHRMIRGFPQVRRWDDTDDVVQAAGLRLHRALGEVELQDARHLLRLVALQIRRELMDLARKYSGPESFAMRHDSNSLVVTDGILMQTDLKPDDPASSDGFELWDRFRAAIDELTEDDREMFDMVWSLGLTQHDIAALLDTSPRTVRRQWDSIKRRLSRALDGEMPS